MPYKLKLSEGTIILQGRWIEVPVSEFKQELNPYLKEKLKTIEKWVQSELVKVLYSVKGLPQSDVALIILQFENESVVELRFGQFRRLYWKDMPEYRKKFLFPSNVEIARAYRNI